MFGRRKKYVLIGFENILWRSICNKALTGYAKSLSMYKSNAIPWIENPTNDEKVLITKIHKYYYGKDWYIADSLGVDQVLYIMVIDCTDYVEYSKEYKKLIKYV